MTAVLRRIPVYYGNPAPCDRPSGIFIDENGGSGAAGQAALEKEPSASPTRSGDRSDFDEDEMGGFGVRMAKKKKKR